MLQCINKKTSGIKMLIQFLLRIRSTFDFTIFHVRPIRKLAAVSSYDPSTRKWTNIMLLYPRIILILSSVYRSSSLNLLSMLTGSPNPPATIAPSSIVTSYILLPVF
uniref:Uncharacterized protein n=1 Tax=Opuntia streptacantha TaxID=393608 RepID=A0A7C9ECY5_OPUST